LALKLLVSVPFRFKDRIEPGLVAWLQSPKTAESAERHNLRLSLRFVQGEPIDVVRNRQGDSFLKSDADCVLLLDSDIIPHPELLALVEHEKPVVGGLCFSFKYYPLGDDPYGGAFPSPVAFKRFSSDSQARLEVRYQPIKDLVGLVECDAVGCGALLVAREVFEAIEPPWFKTLYRPNGALELREDQYFSERVKEAGYRIYVDCNLVCGHKVEVDIAKVLGGWEPIFNPVRSPTVGASDSVGE